MREVCEDYANDTIGKLSEPEVNKRLTVVG
jgi:hypothetical protein